MRKKQKTTMYGIILGVLVLAMMFFLLGNPFKSQSFIGLDSNCVSNEPINAAGIMQWLDNNSLTNAYSMINFPNSLEDYVYNTNTSTWGYTLANYSSCSAIMNVLESQITRPNMTKIMSLEQIKGRSVIKLIENNETTYLFCNNQDITLVKLSSENTNIYFDKLINCTTIVNTNITTNVTANVTSNLTYTTCYKPKLIVSQAVVGNDSNCMSYEQVELTDLLNTNQTQCELAKTYDTEIGCNNSLNKGISALTVIMIGVGVIVLIIAIAVIVTIIVRRKK